MMGGVLHAFRIPLTGLFINGSSVFFISLIGYYSENKREILRATLIVLLIKAGVSPYTPPAAYFAVSLQGLLGEIFFRPKRLFHISTIIFGIVTLTLSSMQKILLLTIVYGTDLWESLNRFGSYISEQFFFLGKIENVSFLVIGFYVGFHMVSGFFIGIAASNLPRWIRESHVEIDMKKIGEVNNKGIKNRGKKRKRKLWIQRPSGILILIMALVIISLTYIFPYFSETAGYRAIVMIIRSILIMSIWFFFISPYFIKYYKKFFKRKESKYSNEVSSVILLLPLFRAIVVYNWKVSKGTFFLKRVKKFIVKTFIYILHADLREETK